MYGRELKTMAPLQHRLRLKVTPLEQNDSTPHLGYFSIHFGDVLSIFISVFGAELSNMGTITGDTGMDVVFLGTNLVIWNSFQNISLHIKTSTWQSTIMTL